MSLEAAKEIVQGRPLARLSDLKDEQF
jgi:hypothetical protein